MQIPRVLITKKLHDPQVTAHTTCRTVEVKANILCVCHQVVLRDDQSVEEGEQIAKGLMEQLQVQPSQLLNGAYMDLILQAQTNGHAQPPTGPAYATSGGE